MESWNVADSEPNHLGLSLAPIGHLLSLEEFLNKVVQNVAISDNKTTEVFQLQLRS